jgi:integrase
VLTLAYTGIRFGEAVALQTANVDLVNRRITIARSATAVTGLGIVETDTKNHTTRAVPIPESLAHELSTLLEGRRPEALAFPSHKGGYLTGTEFRWVFDPAVRATGVDGLVPHGLRHTAASLAISAGANIKVVQRMLGHKTATLTLDLYGHLFPDDLDAVAKGLEIGLKAAADDLRTA